MCVFVVSLVLYKTIFISHSSSLRLFLHKSSQSACNISLCVFGELMIINTLKNQSISIIMLHAFVRTKIQNHFFSFFSSSHSVLKTHNFFLLLIIHRHLFLVQLILYHIFGRLNIFTPKMLFILDFFSVNFRKFFV